MISTLIMISFTLIFKIFFEGLGEIEKRSNLF